MHSCVTSWDRTLNLALSSEFHLSSVSLSRVYWNLILSMESTIGALCVLTVNHQTHARE